MTLYDLKKEKPVRQLLLPKLLKNEIFLILVLITMKINSQVHAAVVEMTLLFKTNLMLMKYLTLLSRNMLLSTEYSI